MAAEPARITVWPGTAYPLGATYDGAGTNFSVFSEVADKVELCLIDDNDARDPDRTRRGRRFRLARLPADRHARPALRVPGARTVGSRQRRPVRSQQAAAGPVRQVLPRRLRLQPGAVFLRPERRGSRLRRHPADGRFAGPHHDQRGDQPVLRLGFRPPPAHPVSRDDHLRGSRQGYDPDPSADSRGTARHLLRPCPPGGDRAPQVAECHRDRTDADPPVHARQAAARAGAAKLLGLQHFRLLRPALSVRGQQAPAGAVAEFKTMVRAFHDAGHRGDPRRRLQPHRRERPPRARRSTSAASTTPPTTGCSTAICGSTRTSPEPATASTPATRTPCN